MKMARLLAGTLRCLTLNLCVSLFLDLSINLVLLHIYVCVYVSAYLWRGVFVALKLLSNELNIYILLFLHFFSPIFSNPTGFYSSIFCAQTGQQIKQVTEHKMAVNDIQPSADYSMFITASKDTSAKVCNINCLGPQCEFGIISFPLMQSSLYLSLLLFSCLIWIALRPSKPTAPNALLTLPLSPLSRYSLFFAYETGSLFSFELLFSRLFLFLLPNPFTFEYLIVVC